MSWFALPVRARAPRLTRRGPPPTRGSPAGTLEAVQQTWLSKRAFRLHGLLIVLVVACSFLGWWQYTRATGGNTLSWVYTFEWPFFAVYGTYMWWKLLHETAEERRARRQHEPAETLLARTAGREAAAADGGTAAGDAGAVAAVDAGALAEIGGQVDALGIDPYDDSDPELAAYNRYLASLHTAPPGRRGPYRRAS